MSRPAIQSIQLNDHLTLLERHPDSECRTNNWWLYDKRAGMNLGIREKSRDEAFVKTIEYWAKRAAKYEQLYANLKTRVDSFVGQFADEDEEN